MNRYLAPGLAGWVLLSVSALAQYPCIEGYQVQNPNAAAVYASAMEEAGNTVRLVGNGGVATSIQMSSYDAVSETWIPASSAVLPVALDVSNTDTDWAPTIDILSVTGSPLYATIITVTGVADGTTSAGGVAPQRMMQWFYQSGSTVDKFGPPNDLLTPGAVLDAATAAFVGDPGNMQTCPNANGSVSLLSYNSFSGRFGSDAALMQVAGRVLMYVGDDSHLSSCFMMPPPDGAVWCYELDLTTSGGPTPICFALIERVPLPPMFFIESRFGHSLAACEGTGDDMSQGRLAIGAPGLQGNTGVFGGAWVYEVATQPSPVAPITQTMAASMSGAIPTPPGQVLGERVAISSDLAFASDATGINVECRVLERQGNGSWTSFPAFPPAIPPAINASSSVVMGLLGLSQVARYQRVGGLWASTAAPATVSNDLIHARGAASFASPGGDRYIRVDGLGQGRLYDSFVSLTNGLIMNSRGLIPTIAPSGPACQASNDLVLTVEGLPFNELVVLFRNSTLVGPALPSSYNLLGAGPLTVVSGTSNAAGIWTTPIDFTQPSMPMAGQTISFQCRYLDSLGLPTMNATEGIQLTVR